MAMAPPKSFAYLGTLSAAETAPSSATIDAGSRLRVPLLRLGIVVLPHQEIPLWLPQRFVDALHRNGGDSVSPLRFALFCAVTRPRTGVVVEVSEAGATGAANGEGEVQLLCRAGRRCRVVMGGDSPGDALDLGVITGTVTVEILHEPLPRRLPTGLERRCSWAPRWVWDRLVTDTSLTSHWHVTDTSLTRHARARWVWDRLDAASLVARAVRELSEHLPRESWLPDGWLEAARWDPAMQVRLGYVVAANLPADSEAQQQARPVIQ